MLEVLGAYKRHGAQVMYSVQNANVSPGKQVLLTLDLGCPLASLKTRREAAEQP
jgi:hypothetical protein